MYTLPHEVLFELTLVFLLQDVSPRPPLLSSRRAPSLSSPSAPRLDDLRFPPLTRPSRQTDALCTSLLKDVPDHLVPSPEHVLDGSKVSFAQASPARGGAEGVPEVEEEGGLRSLAKGKKEAGQCELTVVVHGMAMLLYHYRSPRV